MKSKLLFILLLIVYIVVPVLIAVISKLYDFKFYILTILGILIYLLMRLSKVKKEDLGINNNVFNSVKRNIPLILFFALFIIIFRLIGLNKYAPSEPLYFYLFYIFISCPIQEFLYRGIFGYFEKSLINNKYIMTIVSSLLYSFVHIIYKDIFTCLLTFVIGIIWYNLYRKDYNLFGVSLSHIVLGILTISLGVIN